jgi:hypothetical protein
MIPDYAEALKLSKQLTDALKRLFVELEDKLCKPRKTTCFESIN